MIDEDLRTARQRAHRWEKLHRRRAAIAGLVCEARRKLDAAAVWDQEQVAVEETRLGSYRAVLATLDEELAKVGPARDLYEELLAREERRLASSADPRGAELLEIARLLAELEVELPAWERARSAGRAALRGQGAVGEFVRTVEALGMTMDGAVQEAGAVRGVVERLEERCRELGRLRRRLRARREEVLLG
ncbi:hypothetical protein FH608_001655 [Nonomuraea phyllanthi]|uniref:Uncharacterized protein n=1 Tax=Nonomuraea phyllanthi TaxID=2219224 RepID=A0A5C4WUK3_9ACTN|nr:hypothetical protein [Nonomuraea phyllanthi]KAB8197294.1 hypothetical protein FH608_001655 [Nonomuraea phyllanthi]